MGWKGLFASITLPTSFQLQPIPYWLYKLHGLNIEYRCEICGGHTYRGPKAFQQHFSVSVNGIQSDKHFLCILGVEACPWHEMFGYTKHITFL